MVIAADMLTESRVREDTKCMTDKELRHLSRADLIDIIYELQKQNRQKDILCRKMQNELNRKELILSNAGSIAEASLQINHVMEAAQAAADQYMLSVRAANGEAERILKEAEQERERILQEAREQAGQMSITEITFEEEQEDRYEEQEKAGND